LLLQSKLDSRSSRITAETADEIMENSVDQAVADDTHIASARRANASTTAWYAHADCAAHEMGRSHPESPGRLHSIDDRMIASGLAELVTHGEVPMADEEDLLRVHTQDHIDRLRETSPDAGYAALDADTMMCPASLDAVMRAAGAAVAATDAVIDGRARNAFCSTRPPGHHATRTQAMGFCMVNNIAVAASRALDVHGLSRVAIVDFDVHHGNGTENIFSGDERVLMVSFFQHPFYPYSGFNHPASNMINVPVPAYADGAVVRAVVESKWLPALEAFKPEMIFISAGFDAHREDDLGQMRLVEADYVWMTEKLMALADKYAKGRIVSCLEGGYNLSALGRSVVAHVKALTAN
jgi:acetoin utilization deacetylase AcuC-like enzyme